MAKKTKAITAKQAKDAADKHLDDPKTLKCIIDDINKAIEYSMQSGGYTSNTKLTTQCKNIIDALEAHFVSLGYTVRCRLNNDYNYPMTDFHLSWGDPNETHD